MFDKSFPFRVTGHKIETIDGNDVKLHLLVFRTSKHRTIIVQVYEHDHYMYVLKFFDKNHKYSERKYSLLNSDGEASRIINTCINIMLSFYEKNAYASFAFMGAPTEKELLINKNAGRHGAYNTKRFRLYRLIMSNFFHPVRFLHIQNTGCSVYMVVNRDYLHPNPDEKITQIIQTLKKYYSDELLEEGFE